MTMTDMKCDICGVNLPIGVAITSIPLSVAMCLTCAEHGADPEIVFQYYVDDRGYRPDELSDYLCTFKDGKYINYSEWFNNHAVLQHNDHCIIVFAGLNYTIKRMCGLGYILLAALGNENIVKIIDLTFVHWPAYEREAGRMMAYHIDQASIHHGISRDGHSS